MKILKLTLLVLVGLLTACSPKNLNPILTIEGGQVQGVPCDSSQVIAYKGIPYAAAPVGELRWKKPAPVQPWKGILKADHFSAAAWQANHDPNDGNYGREFFWQGDPEFSEDCLYLNVWTPVNAAGQTEAKLPVTMWVHGGGYSAGWSFEPEMDGEAWAQKGVILVTINYRLGVFGYLNYPELTQEGNGTSGNYGTYDQIAALQWIKKNIAQFGGDPDNITVMGQSAGARSVKNLVTSPLSKELISKAIIQSGGALPMNDTQEKLDSIGKALMDSIGYSNLSEMRKADAPTLYKKVADYMSRHPMFGFLSPHVDGILLKDDFDASIKRGEVADIPYLIGYNANDVSPMDGLINTEAAARDSLSPNKPIFTYLFARPLPEDGKPCLKGAFHSAELWFEFGTLNRSWRPFTAADYDLSKQMISYWTNFAKTGDPNGEELEKWEPHTRINPSYFILNTK